jgi:ubiquinone/menaquinone biosynthesis C-methylase UbiE
MDPKVLAQNLRKPTGANGIEVGEFMYKGNASFYNNIKKLIQFDKELIYGEIGVGAGKHVKDLIQDDIKYYALDYSETMINETKKNCAHLNNVICIYCDAKNIPVRDNFFDILFCVNTIYFWEDLDLFFGEFIRVLKNKGELIIAKRTFEDIIALHQITQFGFVNYTFEDIIKSASKVGFSLVNHLILNENETNVKGITYKLHNEFIHLKK